MCTGHQWSGCGSSSLRAKANSTGSWNGDTRLLQG